MTPIFFSSGITSFILGDTAAANPAELLTSTTTLKQQQLI
jgi:hypothetical protein